MKAMDQSSVWYMLEKQAANNGMKKRNFTPEALRKFAVTTYKQAGGGEKGLRVYFGYKIAKDPNESENLTPFVDNPFIECLKKMIL